MTKRTFINCLFGLNNFLLKNVNPECSSARSQTGLLAMKKKLKIKDLRGLKYILKQTARKNLSPSRTDKTHPADCALRQGTVDEIAMDQT